MQQQQQQQEQPSPLLRLPAELRNRIYHEVFLPSSSGNVFHLTKISLTPPLLLVNHQIRSEASGLFYSSTTFQFSDPAVLIRRLTNLSQKYINLIPEMRYDTSETCTHATSWRTAFRELPGLDEDTKLEGLREELVKQGVRLRNKEILKARVVIGARTNWTSDPLSACLDAVKLGVVVGRMMFV